MTTANAKVINKNGKSNANLTAYMLEDLLNLVIEHANDGYEILLGSTVNYGTIKSVVMVKDVELNQEDTLESITEGFGSNTSEGTPITENLVETIVDTTEETVIELDEDYLITIDGDKDKLEEYGIEFGIDLKKNKKFENMLSDLRVFVSEL